MYKVLAEIGIEVGDFVSGRDSQLCGATKKVGLQEPTFLMNRKPISCKS